MSAKTKTVISLEVVTDHDCGNYYIGEIDVLSHDLIGFFDKYGEKGYNELSKGLVGAAVRINEEFRGYNLRKHPEYDQTQVRKSVLSETTEAKGDQNNTKD